MSSFLIDPTIYIIAQYCTQRDTAHIPGTTFLLAPLPPTNGKVGGDTNLELCRTNLRNSHGLLSLEVADASSSLFAAASPTSRAFGVGARLRLGVQMEARVVNDAEDGALMMRQSRMPKRVAEGCMVPQSWPLPFAKLQEYFVGRAASEE